MVARQLKQAVVIAFKALGSLVEHGTVTIPTTTGYQWGGVEANTASATIPVEVVLVDEKMNHARDATKQRWAIMKLSRVELFSVLTIGTKSYRCAAPLVSYKHIVMVEVYEIQ